MKEKVMLLITNMNIGGTEKALLNMLAVMDPEKYEVDLYLLEKKGGYLGDIPAWVNVLEVNEFQNVKPWIMDLPLKIAGDLVKAGKVIIAARLFAAHVVYKLNSDRTHYYKVVLSQMRDVEKQYDTAIAYTGPFDFATSFVLNKVRAKKKIQWIHFDISKFGFNEAFARRNYPRYTQIAAVSTEAAKQLGQKLPEIKEKITVIPNFVPVSHCVRKAAEYEAYSQGEKQFKILTVGRLSSEKGQIIIPNVVFALLEKGLRDFTWYVIGDGNQREAIEKRISELGVAEYIKMVGLEKNPYPYYRGTDLYVQTSLHEGYCLTIAEARVFGKYIISTDVAGAYDQIKDTSVGKIVPRNTQSLAETIFKFCIQTKKCKFCITN